MRLNCPLCGPRDRREFLYKGPSLTRPEGDVWSAQWDGYLHLRDNPAGRSEEFWQHAGGCAAWLKVTRDTQSHAVLSVERLGAE